jgi:hypothetical protein
MRRAQQLATVKKAKPEAVGVVREHRWGRKSSGPAAEGEPVEDR